MPKKKNLPLTDSCTTLYLGIVKMRSDFWSEYFNESLAKTRLKTLALEYADEMLAEFDKRFALDFVDDLKRSPADE